jgi:nitric oxide reductase NorD protein
MTRTADTDPLESLAGELQGVSPGFAARLRDTSARLRSAAPAALLDTYAVALRRAIAVEGAGREASQALLQLSSSDLVAIGSIGLDAWTAALESVGAHSVRAASAFAAATLAVLPGAAATVTSSLAPAGEAVARLARRHGGDPIVQRFASAAGAVLATRGGNVIDAWATAVESLAFGSRRMIDVASRLADDAELDDDELATALLLVARTTPRERAVALLGTVAASLARVPKEQRLALLDALAPLAASGDEVADALDVAGPVLRRVPPSARAEVLALAQQIAERVPSAVPRFVRTVLRVGEALGFDDMLRAFVLKGIELEAEHPAASRAFFALESRGALAFLRQHDVAVVLEHVEHTLRGYLQLIAPGRPAIDGVEAEGLFPVVSRDPVNIPLARRTDVFPTWEENFTLLKLQATLATLWTSEGTRDFALGVWLDSDDRGGLYELFARFVAPEVAAGMFTHLEAVRLMPVLKRRYPGLAADLRELRERVFPGDRPRAPHGAAQAILFLALGGEPVHVAWDGDWSERLATFVADAVAGEATVYDTAHVTAVLCERLAEGDLIPIYGLESYLEEDPMMSYLLEEAEQYASAPGNDDKAPTPPQVVPEHDPSGERSDETAAAGPLDPEVLRAFLEQNPHLKILRADGPIDPTGLFVAGIMGGGGEHETQPRGATPQSDSVLALSRHGHPTRGVFLHDEWDYLIADYRAQWCRVHEIALDGDNGEFFTGTLVRYADVLPEVRRQFLRVKPEGYRTIHGLLDGEDFDLNAAVDARSDLRAGSTPDGKFYVARQREERDVATLFLLDMSASTDEDTEPAEAVLEDAIRIDPTHPKRRPRRIIDIQKEALVIMSQALEEIGDMYAIYGFSGHGRDRVEFFDVKSFDEPLNLAVRGRIGAIEPQRSTRMGAALRQSINKLRNVASRAKHLILLSDGFPQDFDYGEDRRSNVYGLRDTMMALREAQRAGIAPFCITVDRAGNDYLREMCDEKRYLVIDDIAELPRQLPKVYSEATRGG